MLIDRSKFLLLATTIAASACTVVTKHPNEDDDDDFRDAATTNTDGTNTDTQGSEPTDTDTDGTEPSDSDAGDEPSPSDAGTSADSGSASDAGALDDASSPTEPTADAAVDEGDASTSPTDGDSGAVQACVGDEGEVPSCDDLPENDFESFQSGECAGASVIMKPGVAAHYVECILAQSVDELNDTSNTYACKLEAALAACPDAEAEATCDAFLSYCPDEDRDECLAHANGLSEEGRESFVGCAESSCWGVYSCFEGL